MASGKRHPDERELLVGGVAGRRLGRWGEPSKDPLDFYDAKGLLEETFERAGAGVSFRAGEEYSMLPGRTAELLAGEGGPAPERTAALRDQLSREVASLDAAVEELRAAQERKSYLDAQSHDLTEAIGTLEDAIRRIDRETRERLRALRPVLDVGVVGEPVPEHLEFRRVVLGVAVRIGDQILGGGGEPRSKGAAVPPVARVMDDADLRVLTRELVGDRAGGVVASVVDDDDFEVVRQSAGNLNRLDDEAGNRPGIVVRREEHAEARGRPVARRQGVKP